MGQRRRQPHAWWTKLEDRSTNNGRISRGTARSLGDWVFDNLERQLVEMSGYCPKLRIRTHRMSQRLAHTRGQSEAGLAACEMNLS